MPLQNRVDPFGNLIATAARGTFMGNRGGRLHRPDRTLGTRRSASRRWIACVCSFKDRHRDVWGASYTELFFLDEPTALAAGHRPCFECRSKEAKVFAELFVGASSSSGTRASADQMDAILHEERLRGRGKRTHQRALETLPDGAMIAVGERAFAVRGAALLPWSFEGYGAPHPRRSGLVEVLTPPSIVDVLARSYPPRWHATA